MKKSPIIWIVVVIVIIIGIVLWKKGSAPAPAVTETPAEQPAPAAPVVVVETATSSKLGTFLVAPNGMTLYSFTKDSVGTSTCSGQCSTTWPPYIAVTTGPIIGGTMATGTVSTIARIDGSLQVTYNGWPLYEYSKDLKAGDTLGNKVNTTWFVVKP